MAQATAQSNITTDHETIKNWVEERDGKPAKVKTAGNNSSGGILRIDFPGGDEDNLETISWDDFFEEFEENNLAFLYQDETKDGETSRFNKFIDRDSA